jgi:hypothetical protein
MRFCFVPRVRPASTELDGFSDTASAAPLDPVRRRAIGALRRAAALGFDLVFAICPSWELWELRAATSLARAVPTMEEPVTSARPGRDL